ncbi:hypothetical protein [Clostridium sp.]|uniref:hypothetical protein n=1 Tax=Clostridium sp. TaxID=1506 RepID=UPI002906BEE8|nr:hypothetical protein [Clostridium sp.]MDU3523464.1 hypothetical protein [Clostridium sp.]MDU3546794.1 hypothetical protein [Clostridium sp.]
MKKRKKVLIIILLISIGILTFYLIPMRITPKVPLTSEDISIKVERAGGNTGPVFKVGEDKAKLKKILKEKYPDKDIEPHYIELTGNLPYGVVNDPVFLGDYVVHGTIISPDGGEEKSTIIDVKYTDAKISRLFRDDSQMSGFYEIIIVFISFISAIILIIIFLILFIRKIIKVFKT